MAPQLSRPEPGLRPEASKSSKPIGGKQVATIPARVDVPLCRNTHLYSGEDPSRAVYAQPRRAEQVVVNKLTAE
jgi:hypothetical protein